MTGEPRAPDDGAPRLDWQAPGLRSDQEGVDEQERRALTPRRQDRRKHPLREMIETVAVALVIALLIRHFVVEVFVVDGRSMEPTLVTGERLLVNKFVYRLRAPVQGEVIVFRYPRNPDRDFIKRVIGVTGDTVEVRDSTVYVNGEPLTEPYVRYQDPSNRPPVTVGADAVWVLGDNRNNSEDSRFFGQVPLDHIKGRAFLRFWPPGRWHLFSTPGAGGDDPGAAGTVEPAMAG